MRLEVIGATTLWDPWDWSGAPTFEDEGSRASGPQILWPAG